MKLMIRQEKGDFIIGDCLIEVTTGASLIVYRMVHLCVLSSLIVVYVKMNFGSFSERFAFSK
jgi:hypothetical protein